MIAALESKPLRNLFAAALVLLYPLVGLYPYDWSAPRRVANTASPAPDGGLRFAAPGPGVARAPTPPDWLADAMRTHRVEVELRARPALLGQIGPARLLTLEPDPSERNFTIAQDGAALVVRIRTPTSPRAIPEFRVPGVFAAGAWAEVRVAIAPGRLRVEVDGRRRIDAPLPQTPLDNWDPSYRLHLGNAPTYDRPWFGDIARAVVRSGDVSVDYALPGELRVPRHLWFIHKSADLTLFGNLSATDVAINILGFIPLGALLGVWARARPWGGVWMAVCLIAVASGLLELLQFGIPTRHPSLNDLMFNAAGGVAGIVLGRRLAGPARRKPAG